MVIDGKIFWQQTLSPIILIDDTMITHAIFFYVFSIIAVISAIMVTVSKNTVHSVF